jgi:hypothetical protein
MDCEQCITCRDCWCEENEDLFCSIYVIGDDPNEPPEEHEIEGTNGMNDILKNKMMEHEDEDKACFTACG